MLLKHQQIARQHITKSSACMCAALPSSGFLVARLLQPVQFVVVYVELLLQPAGFLPPFPTPPPPFSFPIPGHLAEF